MSHSNQVIHVALQHHYALEVDSVLCEGTIPRQTQWHHHGIDSRKEILEEPPGPRYQDFNTFG